jgi:tRNA pseudouridine55 synthase
MEKHKPVILNLNKPADISSYDVIRQWKPRLKKIGKVGHFGTLDPFASGVLMLGIAGGQRLNEFIHECLPKTYLAHGVLGVTSETGDLTEGVSQRDESESLQTVIAHLESGFIEKTLKEEYLGEYWQSPHKYSAAKHEGKPLHKWAREGIEIKKEKVRREVYELEVIKYEFPNLWIRFTVSSGTYIRTLFSDCANKLGTLGVLEGLIRERVGGCSLENSLEQKNWDQDEIPFLAVDQVLPFSTILFEEKEAKLYQNGVVLNKDRAKEIVMNKLDFPYYWVKNEQLEILGLAEIKDDQIKIKVNFN